MESLPLKPYSFQEDSVRFIMLRAGTLLGDEAGLGKSISTCLVINEHQPVTTLIVCPAFLCLNWKREVEKWTTEKARIITPDNKEDAKMVLGVTIISYDMMRLMARWYSQFIFDLLVFDESHYLQNEKSLRSKASRLLRARKKICLSGTPVGSRPINLWHQLHLLNPIRWNDYWKFALRYCNAHKESYGWDVSGASNLPELNKILKAEIMIRRTKLEVLKELPEKIRQIIEIPCSNYRSLLDEERKYYDEIQKTISPSQINPNNLSDTFGNEYQDELLHMRANNNYDMSMLATLRKKTGMLKIPAIAEHVNNLIHQGEKVVLFTHHHAITDELRKRLPEALYADGRVRADDRDAIVYRFQNDTSKRLLIAGITALNVGVTLTEATVVVIAEMGWVPSEISQAEDRVCRIGLKHTLLVQHIVLQGSLDLDIARTLVEKQSVINKVID